MAKEWESGVGCGLITPSLWSIVDRAHPRALSPPLDSDWAKGVVEGTEGHLGALMLSRNGKGTEWI